MGDNLRDRASVITFITKKMLVNMHVIAMPRKELALGGLLFSFVQKGQRKKTYHMMNDVGVRRVGHSTMKGLKITEPTRGSSQARLCGLVHQALNSVEELGLLGPRQMTPLLTDSHLFFCASSTEVPRNLFLLGFGRARMKFRVRLSL